MTTTVRITMAQALVRHLAALRIETPGGELQTYCAGVFAIFGHGNVAGIGEALWAERAHLPTWRAHNEQAMAHAAIAYAKAGFRQRMMAVTTSIGPGATNLLTAAALAHVNRLPLLMLPGDTFASRVPDPVLQQLEDAGQGDVSVNDAFRPLTRYFDRISRPEQILNALPHAIAVMLDPVSCGPVCLALPQDVQAQAFDCPTAFLQPAPLRIRRPGVDMHELTTALELIRASARPMLIAGGGVLYGRAWEALAGFAEKHGIPMAETQAGKGSLRWDHPLNLGAIGVTGAPSANAVAAEADLVIAVGTRLQDFTTGSNRLFAGKRVLGINVSALDARKCQGSTLVADAAVALASLDAALGDWTTENHWNTSAKERAAAWLHRVDQLTSADDLPAGVLPYDADVIGVVRDSTADSAASDVVVCAAGTLPAELHKLWRCSVPGNYHVEYGYSCMGYEIAGGLGVKMARPHQEVIVMVGDGSYLMMNSEIATSVMLGLKLIVVVLDNRGFGCIQRLQTATGGAAFNNMLQDCAVPDSGAMQVDFAQHATSLGAEATLATSLDEFRTAMVAARAARKTQVIVINTTHTRTTDDGGCWWDVAIPEVSQRTEVMAARNAYDLARKDNPA
jgi:3D-(3,5/4)-trihydroxycyclohexane-1,2-dione acylhydrolase (decyclizing)